MSARDVPARTSLLAVLSELLACHRRAWCRSCACSGPDRCWGCRRISSSWPRKPAWSRVSGSERSSAGARQERYSPCGGRHGSTASLCWQATGPVGSAKALSDQRGGGGVAPGGGLWAHCGAATGRSCREQRNFGRFPPRPRTGGPKKKVYWWVWTTRWRGHCADSCSSAPYPVVQVSSSRSLRLTAMLPSLEPPNSSVALTRGHQAFLVRSPGRDLAALNKEEMVL